LTLITGGNALSPESTRRLLSGANALQLLQFALVHESRMIEERSSSGKEGVSET
jgi:hypothetical protein